MRNSNVSPINFGTTIRFKSGVKFAETMNQIGTSGKVGSHWSWTAKDIVKAPQAYTLDVQTCTAGGILVKQQQSSDFDIVMFHINPDDKENYDFQGIKDAIYVKLAGAKPLQGFLLGCKRIYETSEDMFDSFERFMKDDLRIPYSKFKGTKDIDHGFIDVAYDGNIDELSVRASAIKDEFNNKFSIEKLPLIFDEIQRSPIDKVVIDESCLGS